MSPDEGTAGTRYLYRFAHCELSEATGELRVRGNTVSLPPRDRAVLFLLVRRAGEFVSTDEAAAAIWGDYPAKGKTVGNAIWNVRQAVGDDDHTIIRNERNRGYMLAAPVERTALAASPTLQLSAGMPVPGRPDHLLTEKIGSGGYGEVWLCTNAHGQQSVFKFSRESRHEAAIKREVTISRLLQASLPEELKDYFVPITEWDFEVWPSYVESPFSGRSLRTWAVHGPGLKSLSLTERLDLMASIGEAVAAAHSVGVLHKDLKPDNILIDESGGRRRMRLTDFGAGHLLAREQAERLDITVRGWTQSMAADATSGTLLWMAPELFEGASPTLQSDVYALGVMLYQIAVGDLGRVLAPDWRPDVADELLCEDIDLATRRDPAQRLADAMELARRLRAFEHRRTERQRLQEQQVRAQQAEEQLKRSRARRPFVWTAIGALLAGLATSSYFHYQQVQKTRTAQALSDFVSEDFLQAALPASGGTATISLKDAMVKAIPLARKRFADQPALEASILTVFGNTLSSLGAYDETVHVMDRLSELDARIHGAGSADVLLDRMIAANSLVMKGDAGSATALLEGLAPQVAIHQKDPQVYGMWLQVNAAFSFQMGRFQQSAEWNEKLVSFLRAHRSDADFDPGVLDVAYLTSVESLLYAGRSIEAEQLGRSTLPEIRASLGEDASYALLMQSLIASAVRDQQRYPEAGAMYSSVCPQLARQFGADNKDAIGCIQNEAELFTDMQRWRDAVPLLKQVTEAYSRLDGCLRTSTCIDTSSDYALVLARTGRVNEALDIASSSVESTHAASDLNETTLPHVLYVYASVALMAGRIEEARQASASLGKALDANPRQTPLWQGHQELLNAKLDRAAGRMQDARNGATLALEHLRARPTRNIVYINEATDFLDGLDR